jgi:hypothetical protein
VESTIIALVFITVGLALIIFNRAYAEYVGQRNLAVRWLTARGLHTVLVDRAVAVIIGALAILIGLVTLFRL